MHTVRHCILWSRKCRVGEQIQLDRATADKNSHLIQVAFFLFIATSNWSITIFTPWSAWSPSGAPLPSFLSARPFSGPRKSRVLHCKIRCKAVQTISGCFFPKKNPFRSIPMSFARTQPSSSAVALDDNGAASTVERCFTWPSPVFISLHWPARGI